MMTAETPPRSSARGARVVGDLIQDRDKEALHAAAV
jgi:hypothetical protein